MNKNSMNLVRRKMYEAIDYWQTLGDWWYPYSPSETTHPRYREKVQKDLTGLREKTDNLTVLVERFIASADDCNSSFSEREELREMLSVLKYIRRGRLDLKGEQFRWRTVSGGLPSLGKQ